MKFKKIRDLLLGCITLVISILYLIIAGQIKTRPKLTPEYANARLIPTLLGVVLAGLSVLLIIQGIRKYKTPDTGKESEKMSKVDLLTIVLTFACMLLYVTILPRLGFILSTILYLFLQITVLAPKEKRNLLLFAAISVIFTAVVFAAFRIGLSQMLPRGPIEELLGY